MWDSGVRIQHTGPSTPLRVARMETGGVQIVIIWLWIEVQGV